MDRTAWTITLTVAAYIVALSFIAAAPLIGILTAAIWTAFIAA